MFIDLNEINNLRKDMFEVEKLEILIEFLGDIQESFNNGMNKFVNDYNK